MEQQPSVIFQEIEDEEVVPAKYEDSADLVHNLGILGWLLDMATKMLQTHCIQNALKILNQLLVCRYCFAFSMVEATIHMRIAQVHDLQGDNQIAWRHLTKAVRQMLMHFLHSISLINLICNTLDEMEQLSSLCDKADTEAMSLKCQILYSMYWMEKKRQSLEGQATRNERSPPTIGGLERQSKLLSEAIDICRGEPRLDSWLHYFNFELLNLLELRQDQERILKIFTREIRHQRLLIKQVEREAWKKRDNQATTSLTLELKNGSSRIDSKSSHLNPLLDYQLALIHHYLKNDEVIKARNCLNNIFRSLKDWWPVTILDQVKSNNNNPKDKQDIEVNESLKIEQERQESPSSSIALWGRYTCWRLNLLDLCCLIEEGEIKMAVERCNQMSECSKSLSEATLVSIDKTFQDKEQLILQVEVPSQEQRQQHISFLRSICQRLCCRLESVELTLSQIQKMEQRHQLCSNIVQSQNDKTKYIITKYWPITNISSNITEGFQKLLLLENVIQFFLLRCEYEKILKLSMKLIQHVQESEQCSNLALPKYWWHIVHTILGQVCHSFGQLLASEMHFNRAIALAQNTHAQSRSAIQLSHLMLDLAHYESNAEYTEKKIERYASQFQIEDGHKAHIDTSTINVIGWKLVQGIVFERKGQFEKTKQMMKSVMSLNNKLMNSKAMFMAILGLSRVMNSVEIPKELIKLVHTGLEICKKNGDQTGYVQLLNEWARIQSQGSEHSIMADKRASLHSLSQIQAIVSEQTRLRNCILMQKGEELKQVIQFGFDRSSRGLTLTNLRGFGPEE